MKSYEAAITSEREHKKNLELLSAEKRVAQQKLADKVHAVKVLKERIQNSKVQNVKDTEEIVIQVSVFYKFLHSFRTWI